ncbi:carbohydrate ABC transporter substrate-binding protein, CUT1 family [Phyllobacterium sp. YR620]|uniref:ABC transporter substrate-binding protein n=1 Tax=unclassified Phyllobacterium TaxID=2638441 RepID=UPI00088931F4|nr:MULTISPECIES: sugar ABC transporter substrate-binding protein [unclassified Phyllobacterium]MRG57529.1 extracellular solute-binding protein [Phyllobacterium sp. SYP-B3895]SDP84047.1 carbohydrate ABC transporter substrate-binding protein, CUT1 family [Phyllobacterium sp. YR620]SFJ23773.1 carbohydrate ABC transporter substrate-binding protein, CUT1 family [Phyllobacterium sp. CL33Tsu]
MSIFKKLSVSCAFVAGLAMGSANAAETVRFWYHFDNPENPMSDLVQKFEAKNPDIKIEAENVPWNSYYDNLYTSLVGGNAPDAGMVKLFAQPRLAEMGALEPLGERINAWPGKADLLDNLLELNKGPDGQQYYLPIQYVVLYLYYRADLFKEAGLNPPTTCEEFRTAAQKLTKSPDTYGFGLRGGKGGWDQWGTFVFSQGAELKPGGLTKPEAVAANQWLIDLFQKDKVIPPSAPNDGFQEIVAAFKAGKTAMTIHHIGSSNDLVKALGDKVSAVPVPKCGGNQWTSYGDESLAIFSGSQVKDAAWKWISFLAEGENNVAFNKATGQMTVTKSGAEHWTLHERRFVDATVQSLPFAHVLPQSTATAEFVNTAWQTSMQQALTGQITSQQMMEQLETLFAQ